MTLSFASAVSDNLRNTMETTMGLSTMELTTMDFNDTSDLKPDDDITTLKLAVKLVNIIILTFLMISMGTAINVADFKDTFRQPAGFFVGMLCQFGFMPLIGFCLSLAFRLEPAGALSILIVACCPGGTLSNLFCYWADGDVCLSVCMTTISTAVAIGMMPLNLFIYSRVWTNEKAVIPYVNIVTTLISILIPVLFGVFLRWWKKDWMKYVTKIAIVISLLLIVVQFTLTFLLNPTFLFSGWQLWFCAASLPLLGYAMGYGLAFLLRQSHQKCRTIAFETGSQNVALATTLTVITFDSSPIFLDMLFYPSLYLCFIYIDSLPIIGVYKLIVYCMKRRSGAGDDEDVSDEKEKPENTINLYENKVVNN